MIEPTNSHSNWVDIRDDARTNDFQTYVYNIAEARSVVRRVLRIVDEQAKQHGLDPLLHQALLQICGVGASQGMPMNTLAVRLDIASAFASRLVKNLETMDLIKRAHSTSDKRVTNVSATKKGVDLLQAIDSAVHFHMAYFQHELSSEQKFAALSIFAFYVGIEPDSEVAAAINRMSSSLDNSKPL